MTIKQMHLCFFNKSK